MRPYWILSLLAASIGTSVPVTASDFPLPPNPNEIRRARVLGTIQKVFVERKGSTIGVKTEKVCDFESTVSVYDLRGGNSGYSVPPIAECQSTMNGKPVTLMAGGAMLISTRYKDKQPDGEVKTANLTLYTRPEDSSVRVQPWISNFFGTRNLNETSFIAYVSPDYFSHPDLDELFALDAEIVDDAQ